MRKSLLAIAMFAASMAASAENWYFVYEGNGWATNETTELKATDNPDVFVLNSCQITVPEGNSGINYQITSAGWTTMYGWCAEADGNDVVGTTYKLGHVGNAWLNCESGIYDVTFNSADETILFTTAGSGGISQIEAEENMPLQYFTLSGMEVSGDKLTHGFYLVKKGKTVTKVIVK